MAAVDRKVAQEKAEDARTRCRNDISAVLRTAEGQRVLLRILEHCGVMSQVMVPGELDRSMLNEGRRLTGLWLLKELTEAEPGLFVMPILRIKS